MKLKKKLMKNTDKLTKNADPLMKKAGKPIKRELRIYLKLMNKDTNDKRNEMRLINGWRQLDSYWKNQRTI